MYWDREYYDCRCSILTTSVLQDLVAPRVRHWRTALKYDSLQVVGNVDRLVLPHRFKRVGTVVIFVNRSNTATWSNMKLSMVATTAGRVMTAVSMQFWERTLALSRIVYSDWSRREVKFDWEERDSRTDLWVLSLWESEVLCPECVCPKVTRSNAA